MLPNQYLDPITVLDTLQQRPTFLCSAGNGFLDQAVETGFYGFNTELDVGVRRRTYDHGVQQNLPRFTSVDEVGERCKDGNVVRFGDGCTVRMTFDNGDEGGFRFGYNMGDVTAADEASTDYGDTGGQRWRHGGDEPE